MAPRKVSQNIVGNEPEEPFLSFFPSRQKWHRIHAHVPMTNLNEWKSKASFVSYVYSLLLALLGRGLGVTLALFTV